MEELAAAKLAATRRTLLRGAGVVGTTGLLAACGTDSADKGGTDVQGETPGKASAGAETGPTAGGDGGTKIAAADIPVGGGAVFASQGVVVTQPTAGTYKGFSARCPHAGCAVAKVERGTINCGCHGSRFSIEDGSVKKGPAKTGLEEKTVTKDGDDIVLG